MAKNKKDIKNKVTVKKVKVKKAKLKASQIDMSQLQLEFDIQSIDNEQLQEMQMFAPQPDSRRKRGRPKIVRDDDMQAVYIAINRAQIEKKQSTVTIEKQQIFQVAQNIIKDSGLQFTKVINKTGKIVLTIKPDDIIYGNPTDIVDDHIDSWDLWDYV